MKIESFSWPFETTSGVEPATEIRIFHAGENLSSKGAVWYDPSEATQLTAIQAATDTRDSIPFDIAHLAITNSPSLEAHASYGWGKLEYRIDGVYITGIEWSQRILPTLRDRGFRYFSPTFYVEPRIVDGEERNYIHSILTVSLTNIPASFNIEPIAASKKDFMDEDTQVVDTSVLDAQVEALAAAHPDEETPAEDVTEAPADETVEEEQASSTPEMTPEEKDNAIAEMKAALEAYQSQVVELNKQCEELRAELEAKSAPAEEAAPEETKEDVVEALCRDGYLQPSLKNWANSLSNEQVKAYAKVTRASAKPVTFSKIVSKTSTETFEEISIEELKKGSIYRSLVRE